MNNPTPNYRDHPLLEGFKGEPDSVLLEAIVRQIELGRYIVQGGKESPYDIELSLLMREEFGKLERPALERILYLTIVATCRANKEVRGTV